MSEDDLRYAHVLDSRHAKTKKNERTKFITFSLLSYRIVLFYHVSVAVFTSSIPKLSFGLMLHDVS